MRKFQKQQILEVIRSLHTLHGKIKDILNGEDYDTVQTALADCQEAAIRIGETIEQIEGSGTQVVFCLEQYCENLYQTSVRMREISAKKAYKSLESSLIKAENALSHMEERKEVVFLPYKVSMWDSLESVWRAADEDPNCDAYVIPIPYYDKNSDGSFKEMHYEGDLYPKYVPITNYEEYDFDGRKPDEIFIHNPYDEFNFVTSVHPFFYAKNLKQFTQMLVYIPYFVLKEVSPDNEEAVKGIEHFCVLPGVFYSDKVIVQSEDMRTVYINVLTKEFGAESRKTWETKILGSGSPKMDKVQNTGKEDVEMPKDWLKIIQKPDGSYKKIIFYNTSINGLLQYNDKMLTKMRNVFNVFRENKDEVALLWRPHPLIKSTISSMRPDLWEAYEKIVQQYLEEGWGIYDDTVDLNRAIALCDAYYGDASSVVQLCQKAEKYAMIQDVTLEDDLLWKKNVHNQTGVAIETAIYHNGKVWFCAQKFNGLFSLDIRTNETRFLGQFPNECHGGQQLYLSSELVDDKIYFIPCRAGTIVVFDTKSEQFSDIKLDEKKMNCRFGSALFAGVNKYRHYLFLFPIQAEAIVRLNVENNELDYITGWVDQVKELAFTQGGAFFRKQGVVVADRIWCPFAKANAVLELDCNAMQATVHALDTEDNVYSGICYDGEGFWLLPRFYGNLIYWDIKTNYIKTVNIHKIGTDEERIKDKMEGRATAYIGILYHNQKVVLFPLNEPEGVEVIRDDESNVEIIDETYSFVREDDDYILICQRRSGKLTILDKKNNSKLIVPIVADAADIDIGSMFVEQQYFMHETVDMNIYQLLEGLNSREKKEPFNQSDKNIGRMVYMEL